MTNEQKQLTFEFIENLDVKLKVALIQHLANLLQSRVLIVFTNDSPIMDDLKHDTMLISSTSETVHKDDFVKVKAGLNVFKWIELKDGIIPVNIQLVDIDENEMFIVTQCGLGFKNTIGDKTPIEIEVVEITNIKTNQKYYSFANNLMQC